MSLFDHLLVPVADDDDATTTARALVPHLETVDRVTAVHVVEKGGGVVDKAPVGKRRTDGRRFLSTLESALATTAPSVRVETHVVFGTDVADTIVETAADVGATAVAFRPRGGSRLARLVSGDTADRLVSDREVTVVALGKPEGVGIGGETDRREAT
jgi:nucleotide-binding universal stress UspA family protein